MGIIPVQEIVMQVSLICNPPPSNFMITSSPFSPLPVFKIHYFFLAKQSRNTAFNSLEIWHQLLSSAIQMLGKHVAIHLFTTTCITFPVRSAYPCRLSLQFSFHCFPIIFFPTGCLPYSRTLVPDDHQSDGSHSYWNHQNDSYVTDS